MTYEKTPPQQSIYYSPVDNPVVSEQYGARKAGLWKGAGYHTGVDYNAAANSNARAAMGGTVSAAGYDPGVGYYVNIQTSPGSYYTYEHLNKLLVKNGQKIAGNDLVGYTGNTGKYSHGAHLHMETVRNGQFVSPSQFFSGAQWAANSTAKGADNLTHKAWTYRGAGAVGGTSPSSSPSGVGSSSPSSPSGGSRVSAFKATIGQPTSIMSRVF